jgi:hypothetical protein
MLRADVTSASGLVSTLRTQSEFPTETNRHNNLGHGPRLTVLDNFQERSDAACQCVEASY